MILLKSSITFEYPTWFLLLCLLVGAAYAAFMYFREKSFNDPSPTLQYFIYLMAFSRFVAISVLAILLLSPFLKSRTTKIEKPVIVIAQDNSESVGASIGDSAAYLKAMNQLKEEIGKKYDVVSYRFGNKLTASEGLNFNDKVTNLSDALKEISDIYYNQNLGAVIFATDGIFNQGINPIYTSLSGNYPIYPIAIGDTTPRRDLKLSEIQFNNLVYLDDRFNVSIDVNAYNLKDKRSKAILYHIVNGKSNKIWEEGFTVGSFQYNKSFDAVVTASSSGVQHYRVALSPVEGEESTQNNYKDIFVEVIDSRQKILVLAFSPHPDLSSIKNVIEANKNYELDIEYLRNFSKDLEQYDLVILHQIPAISNGAGSIVQQIKDKGKPTLTIVGSQYRLNDLEKLHPYLSVSKKSEAYNEVTPNFNQDFNLFKLSESTKQQIAKYPPLYSPFAEYKVSPEAKTLAYQRIGKVQTDYPLIVFNEAFGTKSAVICGEGIWRWRMYNFNQNKNFEAFDELMNKTFQFLTVKSDKRKFRVFTNKNLYFENEGVRISAQLYNDNYELVNEPEVKLNVRDEDGNEYPFSLNRTYNAYELNAGSFPAGNYSYSASVEFANKINTAGGKFSISPLQLEALETQANHQVLYSLAEKTGGQLFYPANLLQISELINDKSVKPVIYDTFNTSSAINLKWIFFLILAMI
ncbi:MAG: VWA domain-containing protein, partial [Chitinophagales bacterium]|nr:VWA domain-containing protein [Chitinophagales bacterium]